ncbi:hypothetical protein [Mesorhizobium japonicum]|uniref:hypothetical protein n=1 Tax=Mesorhizobium japonicum TaxID=2066070 RepID=UPI003B5B9350
MSSSGYAITISDSITADLLDDFRSFREQLRYTLGQLDREAIWLWPLPGGASELLEVPDATLADATEYMQAGGSAEAMIIEYREVVDGVAHQYRVAHSGGDSAPGRDVPFWGNVFTVPPLELFDADEAAAIFDSYRLTRQIPADYTTRELDL